MVKYAETKTCLENEKTLLILGISNFSCVYLIEKDGVKFARKIVYIQNTEVKHINTKIDRWSLRFYKK